MSGEIRNPRGAGRKKLPAEEKAVAIKVVLPPKLAEQMYTVIEQKNYRSVAEYIRELLRKELC